MNYFAIDFTTKTIIGTKTNITKAGRIGSPQYKELCEIMELHPTFSIVAKEIKKNKSKKTYHGLTFQVMEEYIKTQKDSEKMLVKFAAVKRIAETKGSKYPLTKKWFLNTFPAYKVNEISEDETKTLTSKIKTATEAEINAEIEAIFSRSTEEDAA